MRRILPVTLILTSTWLFAISGCGSKSDPGPPKNSTTPPTAQNDTSTDPDGPAPSESPLAEAVPKDEGVQPFDAPSLAELDAKANWQPQPVLDSLELRRKYDAAHPAPVSVSDALKLKNDSPESNEKIVMTLGRLPENENQVDWDSVLVRRLTQDINRTNPIFISSTAEFDVNGLTGFGLFGFDWNMNPFGAADVLKEWSTSEDRLYDKLVMRDDLVWSDGHPITAHDIVFTFQTIMRPGVDPPAVKQGTDQIRWVEAYDDQTVVFFHKQALATNVWNINFPILPKHIYGESINKDLTMKDSDYHRKYEQKPVTGGAYEFVSRTPGQEIVLRRRENYYMFGGKQVRDKPFFKEVRFRVMEDNNTALLSLITGEIHETMLGAAQWVEQTDGDDFYRRNTKASGLEWTYFYFGWNMKDPLFADRQVRQAMGYAFDHDEMLRRLNYGLYEPATGIYHPEAWMAPKSPPRRLRQNTDRARDLLKQAGWNDSDGDGILDKTINGKKVKFEFDMLVSDKPDRVAICNLLRENLDRINIKCNVRTLEAATLLERTHQKQFQAYFAGWGAGADPDTSENLWKTGEARNYCGFSNPEVDQLFIEGRKEFDRDKRAAIYGRIAELVYEEQPYTFLFHQSSFYGFNKKLRGYMFSPRGPYHYGPGISSIWAAKP